MIKRLLSRFMPASHSVTEGFANLGIAPKLLEVLNKSKFLVPTPIQQQSIPIAIEGKDLIGIAQTGTGKTIAFGVPMIQRIARSNRQFKGLVILPTRELAVQVDESLRKIGSPLGLKTAILIGGEAMSKQIRALRHDPHITIATPGRLIDHLETSRLSLSNVGILVLDEADRMLDMGFLPQIKRILQSIPAKRQTMLFSATMPAEIVDIAKAYMHFPLSVEVAPAGTTIKSVTQELFFVEKPDKVKLLATILGKYNGIILVFSRTKHGASKLARAVKNMGYSATEIHSNKSLNQRLGALEGFKIGKYRIMVATDIAARGIDVTGIQLVVNFDLPQTPEDYVHRIGRTGRAGLAGHAISFATPDQRREVKAIERLIKKTLPVSGHAGQVQGSPTREFEGPRQERKAFGKPFHRRGEFRKRSGGRNSRSRDRRQNFTSRPKGFPQESKGYFMERNPYSDE
jgi:ATP-dependent RNA helicase RhlE